MARQQDSRSVENLAEHVRELPIADQVELMRLIAPSILNALDDDARNDLVSDLNEAIARRTSSTAPRR